MKKLLAVLLSLCLVLGLGVTAFAGEADALTLDTPVSLTAEHPDQDYVDEYIDYTFVAPESGTYALCLVATDSAEHPDLWYNVYLSSETAVDAGKNIEAVLFTAEAGQPCDLQLNYWGTFPVAVEFTLWVTKCSPVESITLNTDYDIGTVGGYLSVWASYEPELHDAQELTWSVSDPEIARVADVYGDYVDIELLSVGEVTVTATTAEGLSASLVLYSLEAPEALELVEDEANPVTVTPYVEQAISFTPSETGYYLLSSDNDEVYFSLYADGFPVEDGNVYYLEEGEVYEGFAMTLYGETDCNLYISKTVVLTPVAIEMVTPPASTEFLASVMDSMSSEELLAGLELLVTWSDGSQTLWSYDNDGEYLGQNQYLGWGCTMLEDGTAQADVFVEDQALSWDITFVDLEATAFELVGDPFIEVVERSCGIDLAVLAEMMGMEDAGIEGWYYAPFFGFDRQVSITFSDGSTVTAYPGEYVYGAQVNCYDSIIYGLWEEGEDNTLTYSYMDLSLEVPVVLVESPVESIELNDPPKSVFALGDTNLFEGSAEEGYYFSPRDISVMMEGLSMTIHYKDGTSVTVTDADLEYVNIDGMNYPFYDGYPLGIFSDLTVALEPFTGPCEVEGAVEYKGVSVTYNVELVDELPDEPGEEPEDKPTEEPGDRPVVPSDKDDVVIEPNPETGDTGIVLLFTILTAAALAAVAIVAEKKKFF